jgi:HD superfamily phosphohydrolase
MNRDNRYIQDALYGKIDPNDWLWKEQFDDDFWDYFTCPELQRLREVRLCNINSLYLPGGANIDRFEHAVGTYHLAKECLRSFPLISHIDESTQKNFLIASLLHDFKTSPFGHSVQYIEQKEGFEHEGDFYKAIASGITEPISTETESNEESYEYNFSSLDPIYFGERPKLPKLVGEEDLKQIEGMINGESELGKLISSDMDLDNIDNVYRLAYHIGITDDTETPLKLAKALYVKDGEKRISDEDIHLVENWRETREDLYNFLLLNPGEFSAKCMFTEAVAFAKRETDDLTWKNVDRELIDLLRDNEITGAYRNDEALIYEFSLDLNRTKVVTSDEEPSEELLNIFDDHGFSISRDASIESTQSGWEITEEGRVTRNFVIIQENDEAKVYRKSLRVHNIPELVSRLMRGDLYGCLGIVSVSGDNLESLDRVYSIFNNIDERFKIGSEASTVLPRSLDIRFHAIRDVAKTKRTVSLTLDEAGRKDIGEDSQRILLGIFAANNDLSIYDMDTMSTEMKNDILGKLVQFVKDEIRNIDTDLTVQSIALYEEGTYE